MNDLSIGVEHATRFDAFFKVLYVHDVSVCLSI